MFVGLVTFDPQQLPVQTYQSKQQDCDAYKNREDKDELQK